MVDTMNDAMECSMAGVHGIVHGHNHGVVHGQLHRHPLWTAPWHCPRTTPWVRPWRVSMVLFMDDTMDHPRMPAILWHVPWAPMAYSVNVHNGSNHEVVHAASMLHHGRRHD